MKKLIEFLNRLEKEKIYFKLDKVRNSVLVEVSVPGERWEVEFFEDGSIEIEKYLSNGEIFDETEIDVLFTNFSDN